MCGPSVVWSGLHGVAVGASWRSGSQKSANTVRVCHAQRVTDPHRTVFLLGRGLLVEANRDRGEDGHEHHHPDEGVQLWVLHRPGFPRWEDR